MEGLRTVERDLDRTVWTWTLKIDGKYWIEKEGKDWRGLIKRGDLRQSDYEFSTFRRAIIDVTLFIQPAIIFVVFFTSENGDRNL
jgi:hypothetical protein